MPLPRLVYRVAPRLFTLLTGRNVPKIIRGPAEPQPSIINEKTVRPLYSRGRGHRDLRSRKVRAGSDQRSVRLMSPRIIHIPLSGGDRKAQAKGIRYAHGVHESAYRESVLERRQSAAAAHIFFRCQCCRPYGNS
jgi:hypothetical protein